jgi:ribosome hibernation promoting factor
MSLEIRNQNIEMSDGLRSYIERRLGFALRKFTKVLGRVTVRLSDLNGPRGGLDKRCQISANFRPFQAVSLQATDADLYAAIDRAAGRLERSLAHCVGRKRESRRGRKSIRKPGGPRPQVSEALP